MFVLSKKDGKIDVDSGRSLFDDHFGKGNPQKFTSFQVGKINENHINSPMADEFNASSHSPALRMPTRGSSISPNCWGTGAQSTGMVTAAMHVV